MRILIPFLCMILLASCHNKGDLRKIAELEKENKIISDSLIKQNKIIRLVYDSLIEKQANPLIFCGFDFSEILLTSQPFSTYIKQNSEYKTRLLFVKTQPNTSIVKFSLPSKERDFKKETTELALRDGDSYWRPQYYIKFIPKDTGWYYWNGEMLLKNDRTGAITSYPITDSFYVYK